LTSGNDYPMPFLMSAPDFARRAMRAIDQGVRFKVIPWPMGVVYAILRLMPRAWFDALVGLQKHKKKRRNQSR
jgi:short-subunit dehydrogenase